MDSLYHGRGYEGRKLQENMECEIMHVIIEEARESYREEIVRICQSNTVNDQERNSEMLMSFITKDWSMLHPPPGSDEKRRKKE